MRIAITGHRPDKLGYDYDLKSELTAKIKAKILEIVSPYIGDDHPDTLFITGMALGIDTLFANIAIEKGVPFLAAIPCANQEKMWPKAAQARYHAILNHPLSRIWHVSVRDYFPRCMQNRNEFMVNKLKGHDDFLIAVWDGSPGGTANCVEYAEANTKKIIRINPKEL